MATVEQGAEGGQGFTAPADLAPPTEHFAQAPDMSVAPAKTPSTKDRKPPVQAPGLSPAQQRVQALRQSAQAAERRSDFLAARKSWEALLQSSGGADNEARQELNRVEKELGSFILYHLKDGQCIPEPAPRWGTPGENVVPEPGRVVRVILHKGQHNKDVKLLCDPRIADPSR